MTACQVREGLRVYEFAGEEISRHTTQPAENPRPQWTEMALYKVFPYDPPEDDLLDLHEGGFVVHGAGLSLMYHRRGTSCSTGAIPVPLSEFADRGVPPERAAPCWRCKPPVIWKSARRYLTSPFADDAVEETGSLTLPADTVLNLETQRHWLYRAATAAATARLLEEHKPLSAPAQALLEKAVAASPEFAAVYPHHPAAQRWQAS